MRRSSLRGRSPPHGRRIVRLRCRVVPYTVVVVLHDSAPELGDAAALARAHAPRAARRSSPSTAARATKAPTLAAGWGAEVVALPGDPGFGAANDAGVERAAPRRHRAAEPRLRAARRRRLARSPRASRARPGRAARAAAARPRRQRPALGAPAARDGRARCSRRRCTPPLLPRAVRERLEPYRARARRGPSAGRSPPASPARRRRCAALGPFDAAAHLFARGHGPVPARAGRRDARPCCIPTCGSATPAGTRRSATASPSTLLARRRRAVIGADARAPRAAARRPRAGPDVRLACRRRTRVLGGDARRPARQLAALAPRARRS